VNPGLDPEFSSRRYDRHHLIDWWDQNLLSKSRVLVAGAGAIGNEVIKNLALLGVGTIWIIDFDTVDITNLTRSILFREEDIGRPKAEVAAARAKVINPLLDIFALPGDLELDLGLGLLREFNLVFGCVDSIHARWVLNRSCRRVGVPWIDAGIGPSSGEISFFLPDHSVCYECSMTPAMWKEIDKRYSCMKMLNEIPADTQPTTAIAASVCAAIQVQQALAWLHGFSSRNCLGPGQRLFFQMKPYDMLVHDVSPDPDCLAHVPPIKEIIPFPGDLSVLTPYSIMQSLHGKGIEAISLVLGFDLVTSLECPGCEPKEAIGPVKKFSGKSAQCPSCGGLRKPVLVSEIAADGPLVHKTLAVIGIPTRPILSIKTPNEYRYIEITEP
jgi:adenylyltransferase/sulfurtransferase